MFPYFLSTGDDGPEQDKGLSALAGEMKMKKAVLGIK